MRQNAPNRIYIFFGGATPRPRSAGGSAPVSQEGKGREGKEQGEANGRDREGDKGKTKKKIGGWEEARETGRGREEGSERGERGRDRGGGRRCTHYSKQKSAPMCLTLLDLSAAFDTTDHTILIHRLSTWFGITGIALDWFTSYLTSRSFIVTASGLSSSSFPITSGIPQGSVLGPILFNLYTTPLSSLTNSFSCTHNHHLYADDTQLYISFSPSSEAIK
jgi:hypothetical protein